LAPHAANLMTAARIALTPLFVALAISAPQHRAAGVIAVLVFAAIAASDVWDGRVARRFGRESAAGRIFDHFADIGFLMPGLGVYVWLGLMPWWVPAAVLAAFTFYVVDSQRRRSGGPPSLITSRIGHTGGVANYVLVGVLVCNNSAGIGLLSPTFLYGLYLLVPLYSAAAVAARLLSRSPQASARSSLAR
jgi:CDP-diacylglycerol--glycerol-3-phosphate 3-phosphatidyltransferase